jgi:hypothetical protein
MTMKFDIHRLQAGLQRHRVVLLAFALVALLQLALSGALLLRPGAPAVPVAVTQAAPTAAPAAEEDTGALPTIYPGT